MVDMKGYFACPLAQGRDRETALALVNVIESFGHTILDRHVVAEEGRGREEFCKNSGIGPKNFNPQSVRKQDLEWVMQAEFMVLDYTNGSWGGGIEFDHATVLRKALGLKPIPILCLRHKDAKASCLILGIDRQEFSLVFFEEYETLIEAKELTMRFINSIWKGEHLASHNMY